MSISTSSDVALLVVVEKLATKLCNGEITPVMNTNVIQALEAENVELFEELKGLKAQLIKLKSQVVTPPNVAAEPKSETDNKIKKKRAFGDIIQDKELNSCPDRSSHKKVTPDEAKSFHKTVENREIRETENVPECTQQ